MNKGPNQQLKPDQLEQAIGPDVLNTLSQHTGLSRQELLSRLTRELPAAVDKFTPDGRVPPEEEAGRLIGFRGGYVLHIFQPLRDDAAGAQPAFSDAVCIVPGGRDSRAR